MLKYNFLSILIISQIINFFHSLMCSNIKNRLIINDYYGFSIFLKTKIIIACQGNILLNLL